MSTPHEPPEDHDPLAEEEAALALREAGLLLALEDAALEAAEVRAFASDVRVRLLRHVDAGSPDARRQLAILDALELPELASIDFDARRRKIRRDAIEARRALVEALDDALERGHEAVDAALEQVREARDLMLRGRLWRPTPESTPIPEAKEQSTATVIAPAIMLDTGGQDRPTRSMARPESLVDTPPRLVDLPGPAALRAGFRRKLETRVDFQSDSNFFSGFSSNISDGGLFIATPTVMPVGSELEVSLGLPDSLVIKTRCVVRWVRPAHPDLPAGLGVEFVDLDARERDAIHRFMRRRDPIFHEI